MRDGKIKEEFFSAIITGFIELAFKGISSFLHHKRHKALHKVVKARSISIEAQRNKFMHLENTLVMYGIYNAKTLENVVKTVHALHSKQTLYKGIFAGQTSAAYEAYSQMHDTCGIQHYHS